MSGGTGDTARRGGHRIRCVLFDLDGTLVDTWDLYIETFLRTLEGYLGRRPTLDELRALHPTSELRVLRQVVGSDAELLEAHRTFLGHFAALHDSLFAGPYAGVHAMLEALRARGMLLGVVTGKSRGAWELSRSAAALGDFAVAVLDDDVAEPKPHPEGILRALEAIGIPASAAVYVGDSINDARAARAAGVRFAAALWAKTDGERDGFVEKVEAEGVWAVLADPAVLIDLLDPNSRST